MDIDFYHVIYSNIKSIFKHVQKQLVMELRVSFGYFNMLTKLSRYEHRHHLGGKELMLVFPIPLSSVYHFTAGRPCLCLWKCWHIQWRIKLPPTKHRATQVCKYISYCVKSKIKSFTHWPVVKLSFIRFCTFTAQQMISNFSSQAVHSVGAQGIGGLINLSKMTVKIYYVVRIVEQIALWR